MAQLTAAWALTNIASGKTKHTQAVINNDAVRILVRLLKSPNTDVRQQAVWAIGNIAGDSPQSRDILLEKGVLLHLRHTLFEEHSLLVIQTTTWALSNLCRHSPRPPLDKIIPALYGLENLIDHDDGQMLTDAIWGLSYFSEGTRDECEAVIEADLLPKLLKLLSLSCFPSLVSAVLNTVRNIIKHDEEHNLQTQNIIKSGGLSYLKDVLTTGCYNVSHKAEGCWIISRIVTGNSEQLRAVIDEGIPLLLNYFNILD